MTRLVKRYGNRKLYDTQESRYVTLEDIAGFVRAGEELQVIDNDSTEDLTAVTFAQIILEQERKSSGIVPVALLRKMIEQGEEALQGLAQRVDKEMEALRSMSEKAGRRVQELVAENVERRVEGGKQMLADLIRVPQQRLETLQRRIDDGVRESVDRLKAVPAVQREIARIEKSIQRLEGALSRVTRDHDAHGPSDRRPGDPGS